jgi:hypothetical protein
MQQSASLVHSHSPVLQRLLSASMHVGTAGSPQELPASDQLPLPKPLPEPLPAPELPLQLPVQHS